jgi:hypothetical protein
LHLEYLDCQLSATALPHKQRLQGFRHGKQ